MYTLNKVVKQIKSKQTNKKHRQTDKQANKQQQSKQMILCAPQTETLH